MYIVPQHVQGPSHVHVEITCVINQSSSVHCQAIFPNKVKINILNYTYLTRTHIKHVLKVFVHMHLHFVYTNFNTSWTTKICQAVNICKQQQETIFV